MPTAFHAIAAGLVLAVLLSAPAGAATPEELRQQAQQACFGDAQKLCSDALADDAKTTACMKAHRSQLSARCLKVYDKAFGS